MTAKPVFKRILLKLSGEAFMGKQGFGIDDHTVAEIAAEVKEVHGLGVQIGIIVGGGNIFRGRTSDARGFDRVTADQMGMLATLINGLALQNAMEKLGVATRVLSAIEVAQLAEPFIRRRAIRHLEKGRVIIFAAGTGNPYFSTDTAAALRAVEIKAGLLAKATKVDGVYDQDPLAHPNAVRYPRITHQEVLERNLGVMDSTAISLCMDNGLPIIVYNLRQKGNLRRIATGGKVGTVVE
ncbi:MAG: UMP kinase, partial [Candidatus Acidiferrales bacterium]